MKVGIIGFARSGKTTIFNSLTGSKAAVGAFGAREANVAVIKVPDERVDKLSEFFNPKKKTYAEVEFLDIAPGEGSSDKALDSAALATLKNVDALVHVVRAFDNENVMHPLDRVDPVGDVKALDEELLLTDLIVIEKRIERLIKEHHKDNAEHKVLERCREHLENGAPLRTLELNPQDEKEILGFGFLSRKPMLLLSNYGEESIGKPDPGGLEAHAKEHGLILIAFCGTMEMEVTQLPPEERAAFREELGLGEESRTQFLQAAYDMLGLMSFLTAGEPEVRAWTIRKGTKAVDSAGVIHSDIQRGFIRAEITSYDDFLKHGSMVKAKEHGAMRLEGKEYIMQDGDIVLFRFNV
ncbi:MAG: redox-regulated ATPase YchF [FCB group bacterium]|jgi:GTP-binding protein YchF|nr:redox-regulated ATPase YchF [FCB group bacterium]